jgi:hypothetical protein
MIIGEAQLEDSLDKIRTGWETQAFTVMTHRDQHGLFILGSLEEIFTLLEDNQVTLQVHPPPIYTILYTILNPLLQPPNVHTPTPADHAGQPLHQRHSGPRG